MPNLHPKTKTVTIDGTDYLIAPLSMAAIETLVEGDHSGEQFQEQRRRLWSMIASSMGRATGEAPTLDHLRESLDLEGFSQMLAEVRAVSGLTLKTPAL